MAAQGLAAAKLKHFFASMSKKLTIGEGMKNRIKKIPEKYECIKYT